MDTIGTRLRLAMDERGYGVADLVARKVISRAGVYQWLNDTVKRDKVRDETVKKICKALGVERDWLLDGRGPRYLADATPTPITPPETPVGYVRFQLLDGFVSAGDGGYVPDYPEVVREISVAEEWARRNLAAPHDRIRVVTAQGDSMQPEIGSGDVLFVDSGVTFFDTDAVYVMNWQGRPIVKRLQMRRDGTLVIKSSNPSYEPETVPAGEIDQLFITGRVIGVWQFRAH